MAEELFRSQVNGDRSIEVSSAGIGAVDGQSPSAYAVEVMKEKGLDISGLRSRPIQQEMVRKADCIFVMTYGHLDSLLLLYPAAAEKTFMLREFQPACHPKSGSWMIRLGSPGKRIGLAETRFSSLFLL